jgi:putative acetyltransferase
MQIREMEEKDLAAVREICAAVSAGAAEAGEGGGTAAWPVERLVMCRDAHPGGSFVAVDGSTILGGGFCRIWGRTGWVGPVAVDPARQGDGVGTLLLDRLLEELQRRGAAVIGAEISPSASRGIGFLARRAFKPIHAALQLERTLSEGSAAGYEEGAILPVYFSSLVPEERGRFLEDVRLLSASLDQDLDYSGEVQAVDNTEAGESLLFRRGEDPVALAVCLTKPAPAGLPEGRLQVQILALDEGAPYESLDTLLVSLELLAREARLDHVVLPVPGRSWDALQALLERGYRVRQADLRLNLLGFPERGAPGKVNFARWR